jgi:hypothetical protein
MLHTLGLWGPEFRTGPFAARFLTRKANIRRRVHGIDTGFI